MNRLVHFLIFVVFAASLAISPSTTKAAPFNLFFEGDSGSVLGDGGVQVQTYATFDDVINSNLASSEPTAWTIGPNIDLAGVANDGQFRLFFEGDSGSVLGDGGVQVQTYATFDDVIDSNLASSEPTAWTIGPNIDLAGIAYDGQFRLLFEGDSGSVLGDGGVQVQTYATYDDLLNSSLASSEPTAWTIGPNIDLAGVVSPDSQIHSVPSPTTFGVLLIALAGLGLFDWRHRRVTVRTRTPLQVRGFGFLGS